MEHEEVIDIMREAGKESIDKLVAKLNLDGIVSDEDGCLISSYMVERWTAESTEYLRDNEYKGGKLTMHAKFFSGHGAVYVLFDENEHTYDSATKYMDEYVENYDIS
ncbi:hypothetical protein QE250_07800 [Chromatiaceae bacterium AAb-1]|nr:hypothetical protein [Chromatiaceae bacterium AAb-1]